MEISKDGMVKLKIPFTCKYALSAEEIDVSAATITWQTIASKNPEVASFFSRLTLWDYSRFILSPTLGVPALAIDFLKADVVDSSAHPSDHEQIATAQPKVLAVDAVGDGAISITQKQSFELEMKYLSLATPLTSIPAGAELNVMVNTEFLNIEYVAKKSSKKLNNGSGSGTNIATNGRNGENGAINGQNGNGNNAGQGGVTPRLERNEDSDSDVGNARIRKLFDVMVLMRRTVTTTPVSGVPASGPITLVGGGATLPQAVGATHADAPCRAAPMPMGQELGHEGIGNTSAGAAGIPAALGTQGGSTTIEIRRFDSDEEVLLTDSPLNDIRNLWRRNLSVDNLLWIRDIMEAYVYSSVQEFCNQQKGKSEAEQKTAEQKQKRKQEAGARRGIDEVTLRCQQEILEIYSPVFQNLINNYLDSITAILSVRIKNHEQRERQQREAERRRARRRNDLAEDQGLSSDEEVPLDQENREGNPGENGRNTDDDADQTAIIDGEKSSMENRQAARLRRFFLRTCKSNDLTGSYLMLMSLAGAGIEYGQFPPYFLSREYATGEYATEDDTCVGTAASEKCVDVLRLLLKQEKLFPSLGDKVSDSSTGNGDSHRESSWNDGTQEPSPKAIEFESKTQLYKEDLNRVSSYGHTPLTAACSNGNPEIVRLLLENRTVNVNRSGRAKNAPLHFCCAGWERGNTRGQNNTNRLLLNTFNTNRGSLIRNSFPSLNGIGTEDSAQLNPYTECVRLLMYYRKDIGLVEGQNPSPDENLKDLNTNQQNIYGETPLHIAAEMGAAEIVKILLDNTHTNVNIRNNQMHLNIFQRRDERDAEDEDLSSPDGDIPLTVAVFENHIATVQLMFEREELDIGCIGYKGNTVFHHAAVRGYSELFSLLLKGWKEKQIRDRKVDVTLSSARSSSTSISDQTTAAGGSSGTISTIGSSPRDLKTPRTINSITSPRVDDATPRIDEEATLTIAERTPRVQETPRIGGTPRLDGVYETPRLADATTMAVQKSPTGSRLLTSPDPLTQRNDLGSQPLHLAAGEGAVEIIKILLSEPSVDPNAGSERGNAPLLWSAWKGQSASVRALLEDPRVKVNARNVEHYTAIHYCAEYDFQDCIEVMMEERIHVSEQLDNNFNPIIPDVLDLNSQDEDGETALHCSAGWGHAKIVQLLLRKGLNPGGSAGVNLGDGAVRLSLQTPQSPSSTLRKSPVTLSQPLNLGLKNKRGETAFHFACQDGYRRCAEMIWRMACVTGHFVVERDSSIMGATGHGSSSNVDKNDSKKIYISDVNEELRTVFHSVCLRGHVDVLKFLLEKVFKLVEVEHLDEDGNVIEYGIIGTGKRASIRVRNSAKSPRGNGANETSNGASQNGANHGGTDAPNNSGNEGFDLLQDSGSDDVAAANQVATYSTRGEHVHDSEKQVIAGPEAGIGSMPASEVVEGTSSRIDAPSFSKRKILKILRMQDQDRLTCMGLAVKHGQTEIVELFDRYGLELVIPDEPNPDEFYGNSLRFVDYTEGEQSDDGNIGSVAGREMDTKVVKRMCERDKIEGVDSSLTDHIDNLLTRAHTQLPSGGALSLSSHVHENHSGSASFDRDRMHPHIQSVVQNQVSLSDDIHGNLSRDHSPSNDQLVAPSARVQRILAHDVPSASSVSKPAAWPSGSDSKSSSTLPPVLRFGGSRPSSKNRVGFSVTTGQDEANTRTPRAVGSVWNDGTLEDGFNGGSDDVRAAGSVWNDGTLEDGFNGASDDVRAAGSVWNDGTIDPTPTVETSSSASSNAATTDLVDLMDNRRGYASLVAEKASAFNGVGTEEIPSSGRDSAEDLSSKQQQKRKVILIRDDFDDPDMPKYLQRTVNQKPDQSHPSSPAYPFTTIAGDSNSASSDYQGHQPQNYQILQKRLQGVSALAPNTVVQETGGSASLSLRDERQRRKMANERRMMEDEERKQRHVAQRIEQERQQIEKKEQQRIRRASEEKSENARAEMEGFEAGFLCTDIIPFPVERAVNRFVRRHESGFYRFLDNNYPKWDRHFMAIEMVLDIVRNLFVGACTENQKRISLWIQQLLFDLELNGNYWVEKIYPNLEETVFTARLFAKFGRETYLFDEQMVVAKIQSSTSSGKEKNAMIIQEGNLVEAIRHRERSVSKSLTEAISENGKITVLPGHNKDQVTNQVPKIRNEYSRICVKINDRYHKISLQFYEHYLDFVQKIMPLMMDLATHSFICKEKIRAILLAAKKDVRRNYRKMKLQLYEKYLDAVMLAMPIGMEIYIWYYKRIRPTKIRLSEIAAYHWMVVSVTARENYHAIYWGLYDRYLECLTIAMPIGMKLYIWYWMKKEALKAWILSMKKRLSEKASYCCRLVSVTAKESSSAIYWALYDRYLECLTIAMPIGMELYIRYWMKKEEIKRGYRTMRFYDQYLEVLTLAIRKLSNASDELAQRMPQIINVAHDADAVPQFEEGLLCTDIIPFRVEQAINGFIKKHFFENDGILSMGFTMDKQKYILGRMFQRGSMERSSQLVVFGQQQAFLAGDQLRSLVMLGTERYYDVMTKCFVAFCYGSNRAMVLSQQVSQNVYTQNVRDYFSKANFQENLPIVTDRIRVSMVQTFQNRMSTIRMSLLEEGLMLPTYFPKIYDLKPLEYHIEYLRVRGEWLRFKMVVAAKILKEQGISGIVDTAYRNWCDNQALLKDYLHAYLELEREIWNQNRRNLRVRAEERWRREAADKGRYEGEYSIWKYEEPSPEIDVLDWEYLKSSPTFGLLATAYMLVLTANFGKVKRRGGK